MKPSSARPGRVGARRATTERRAAGGDVGNLESVKSAAKAVEDAEKAVTKANRGLDQAADKADRAAGSTMTAAANLNFLLSQLSPAERRLYEAGTHLYESYKKIFQGTGTGGSGIYGVIIDSFTRAVEQVEKIMEMPKVISAVQGLANVIGANIDKIVGAVADPTVLNQLIGIIDAAGENLGPLVDMAIDLGKAFLNIAETANPAFQDLIKYVGPVVDKFLGLTSDKGKMEDFFSSGEKHLESWLDLVLAIIGLFAALVGASADSGKTSIDDLTKRIKTYTDWIDDHHDQVVAFFEDARKAAYKIGGVLENLAKTLLSHSMPSASSTSPLSSTTLSSRRSVTSSTLLVMSPTRSLISSRTRSSPNWPSGESHCYSPQSWPSRSSGHSLASASRC
jgi:hypothetical protein